jgi:hypothetical protein
VLIVEKQREKNGLNNHFLPIPTSSWRFLLLLAVESLKNGKKKKNAKKMSVKGRNG